MSKFDFLSGNNPDIEKFMAKQEQYKKLKKSELDSVPKNEIVMAVTSWIEGKFADDWSDMCRVINSLPTPCLNVYCADYVTKEVMNGGFAQAFFNSSRDYIGAAAEGLRALGYAEPAEAVENALKINYDNGGVSGRSFEDFLAFCGNNDYAETDSRFYSTFDDKKFTSLAYDYIIRYKQYFGDE